MAQFLYGQHDSCKQLWLGMPTMLIGLCCECHEKKLADMSRRAKCMNVVGNAVFRSVEVVVGSGDPLNVFSSPILEWTYNDGTC